MTDHVFVYGSLKIGGWLNGYLKDAKLVRITKTRDPGWSLVNTGQYPAMVVGNAYVKGQVYEIPDALLPHLDHAEGVPHLFKRGRIMLDDWPFPVWAYIFADPKLIDQTPANEGVTLDWDVWDNTVKPEGVDKATEIM